MTTDDISLDYHMEDEFQALRTLLLVPAAVVHFMMLLLAAWMKAALQYDGYFR